MGTYQVAVDHDLELVILVFGLEDERQKKGGGLGCQLFVNNRVKFAFGEYLGDFGEVTLTKKNFRLVFQKSYKGLRFPVA